MDPRRAVVIEDDMDLSILIIPDTGLSGIEVIWAIRKFTDARS